MASQSIKVYSRFRPHNKLEKSMKGGQGSCVEFESDTNIKVEGSKGLKEFVFDHNFLTTCTQEEVYSKTAQPLVAQVFKGFNATVFAYGQTGSGKTWTMMGDMDNPQLQGIIPRLVDGLFEKKFEAHESIEITIKVSYVEIYMEKISDLLDLRKRNLKLRQSKDKSIYIESVTEIFVDCQEDVYTIMAEGMDNRAVAATKMNAESSRSHSVFLITVNQTDRIKGTQTSSKLILVDLAGSEKVGKTGASGQTLNEAKHINKSLTMLGIVIQHLTEGQKHIPYRDSQLTRLLSDSLGGNSRTCLIVTASTSPYNAEETMSTLRFGERAKKIKNKAKANTVLNANEYRRLLAMAKKKIKEHEKTIKSLKKKLSEKEKSDTHNETQLSEKEKSDTHNETQLSEEKGDTHNETQLSEEKGDTHNETQLSEEKGDTHNETQLSEEKGDTHNETSNIEDEELNFEDEALNFEDEEQKPFDEGQTQELQGKINRLENVNQELEEDVNRITNDLEKQTNYSKNADEKFAHYKRERDFNEKIMESRVKELTAENKKLNKEIAHFIDVLIKKADEDVDNKSVNELTQPHKFSTLIRMKHSEHDLDKSPKGKNKKPKGGKSLEIYHLRETLQHLEQVLASKEMDMAQIYKDRKDVQELNKEAAERKDKRIEELLKELEKKEKYISKLSSPTISMLSSPRKRMKPATRFRSGSAFRPIRKFHSNAELQSEFFNQEYQIGQRVEIKRDNNSWGFGKINEVNQKQRAYMCLFDNDYRANLITFKEANSMIREPSV